MFNFVPQILSSEHHTRMNLEVQYLSTMGDLQNLP